MARRHSNNGAGNGRQGHDRSRRRTKKQQYQENPGWGTAFKRADNHPPRPQFTGEGMLDAEIVDAIMDAGGKFQISVWTTDNEGRPLRNRDGSRRIRLHIEAPYEEAGAERDDDFDDDDDDFDDDDDEDPPEYNYGRNGYRPVNDPQNIPF